MFRSTGYAAAGVVRQRTAQSMTMKILDMSRQLEEKEDDKSKHKSRKEKEKGKESKKLSSFHRIDEGKEDQAHDSSFNPFLQTLAVSLSNKTMSFSFTNE